MSIRFKCPHCQKSLSVKDEFAGRKGNCPVCKKGLTVPAPVAAPADVEDLAAATFTDRSAAPPPPAAPETHIQFACPQCDAPIKMEAALAGKQAPCPECRRIIKVPQLVKDEPVDWRKPGATRGPSGARRDTEPAPEGVWGSAVSTARASEETLVAAGVIVEEREPWTTAQKVKWSVVGVAVAGLLAAALWGGFSWRDQMRQKRALEQALQMVSTDGGKPRLSADRDAAIHLAAGEFWLRTGKRDCVVKALEHFRTARALLSKSNTSDRDLLLAELALAQVDIGGSGDDIDRGRRLKWDQTQKEIKLTLNEISAPATRIEALRSVARQLVARGQEKSVASLAQQVSTPDTTPEALAVVGLELLSAEQPALARTIVAQAVAAYQRPAGPPAVDRTSRDPLELDLSGKDSPPRVTDENRPPPPSVLVALCLALDRADALKNVKDRGEYWKAGEVEAWARKGDLARARSDVVQLTLPQHRLRALTAIAAAAVDRQDPSASTDLEAAVALAENDLRADLSTPQLLRLLRLGVRAGQTARLDRLARAVKDPGLRAWAQYELFRAELPGKKTPAEDPFTESGKDRLAHALALGALARQRARLEGRPLAAVESWEENLRPFGHAGAALGMQDRSQ